MTSSEKLCLQWNDFKQNTSSAFGILRGDGDFSDVTLVCEDGQQIEAHKVILAASSPFFKELLRKNQHPHPLVYLRGLKSDDLVAMIDFLYFGEANVLQENLEIFLAFAEELKLKGLTKGANDVVGSELETKSSTSSKAESLKKGGLQQSRNRGGNKDVEYETVTNPEAIVAVVNKNTIPADLDDLDDQIRSMITKSDISLGPGKGKMATCNICGKQAPYRDLPRHVEANHLSGVSHACDVCGSVSRSKNGLRLHKMKYHIDANVVAEPGIL